MGRIKKDIEIRQHDESDCAAACLASILGYYGLNVPLIEVRDACGVNSKGTNIHSIVVGARKFGLDAFGAKSKSNDPLELKEIASPLILHLKRESGWLHFVVYYGEKRGRALIMDPESGKLETIEFKDLARVWTGYVVSLSVGDSFAKGDRRTSYLSRIRFIAKESKKEILLTGAGVLAHIAITYSFSLFLQLLIDKAIPNGENSTILWIAATLLLMSISMLIISTLRGNILLRGVIKSNTLLATGYFGKLLRLPISFFESRSPAEISSRIWDAFRIGNFISSGITAIAISFISLAISMVLLIYFNWKLSIIIFSITPLYILIFFIYSKIAVKDNRRIIESSATMQQHTIGILGNINSIKYCGATSLAARRFERAYAQNALSIFRGGRNMNITSSITEAISRMITASILIFGGLFSIRGELSLGELASFYTMSTLFTSPLLSLIESNKTITETQIATERLFEIMELPDENGSNEVFRNIPEGDIRIENITFAYPGQFNLFEDFSATFKRNEINIIIGENGSGKSTLGKLLMRGYKADKGIISIDETDISHIDTEIWRRFITLVPQTAELIEGSILENISLGKEENIEEIMEICKEVGLLELFKKLPQGILSDIGENGGKLSGGERQKISLARALYTHCETLIIDEGGSHLDHKSKEQYHSLLLKLKEKGHTIILITHESHEKLLSGNIIRLRNRRLSSLPEKGNITSKN